MVPIGLALAPAAAFAALGTALDRALRLGLDLGAGVRRWPRRIACGLTAAFAAYVHPAVAALLLALALAARPRSAAVDPAGLPLRRWPWLGATAALLAAAIVLRPAVPMYWDAFVWLGKARVESGGFGALRAAALDPSANLIPRGYPLLWPLAASWLSMCGRSAAALVAGAAATTLLALLLFLDAAAAAFDDGDEPARRPAWALGAGLALLGATPLLWVHLRSAYADLPVGLLAATCALRLGREIERRGDGRDRGHDLAVAAIAAAALAGLKDEGIGHVAMVAVAAAAAGRLTGRGSLRAPLAVLGAAAVVASGWRVLLGEHHVLNTDHAISAPCFAALGQIARTVSASAADPETWGALWPIAAGACAVVLARRRAFRPATLVAALALIGEAAMLGSALVFGPDRVRVFAFEGTLVNRLLVQLAPPAGALLMLALGDAASRAGAEAPGVSGAGRS